MTRPASTAPNAVCDHCGRAFVVLPYLLKKGLGRFCSRRCLGDTKVVPPAMQLERHVDRSGGPDACWPWTARRDDDGYGVFHHKRRRTRAHRVAWELANGRSIPAGLVIRHLCPSGGKPWCCNPAHLAVGTVLDNHEDRARDGNVPTGVTHGRARLTDDQVIAIRTRRANGEVVRALAREFGVGSTTAEHIVSRRTWRHLP